jgi:hypothetical protein
LILMAGCSKAAAPPDAARPAASSESDKKAAEADGAAAVSKAAPKPFAETSKLPAAEFQQPAALPSSAPLPKAAMDDSAFPASDGSDLAAVEERVLAPIGKKQDPAASSGHGRHEADDVDRPPATVKSLSGRPQTGKNSGVPFDPIAVNGPTFVGWPKPKLAMVITGMEEGYLEPCGCAGLDRMKGGMGRRATLFKELRREGWPVLALDVGGLVQGFGRQAELKFQTAVEGKRRMKYDAIAFGADDLRLPAGELVAVAAGIDGKASPFVSANVGLLGQPGEITPQSHILQAGGMKIGVTAVLGKSYQKEIHNDEIEMTDPVAALEKIVPELQRNADYLVLLAHATMDESIELGRRFPAFQLVVTSDGPSEPPATAQRIEGTKTLLVTVGYKGMNAVVLGFFDNAAHPLRYQRVPLDSRFASSPDMKMLMTAYQDQLKAIGFAGLGLRPAPHSLAETNRQFIGSQKCESCHEESYRIWKKSGHGHAYDTLVKLDPPRQFDPECVSCHVTGWHPTKFFPYQSGFESLDKTPRLINTGCEDCHGPGEKHAEAEMGSDRVLQEKYRQAVVITKAQSKKQQCYSCHDLDNSPDFDFDKYWPYVEHYEKE